MTKQQLAPWLAFCAGALLVAFIAWMGPSTVAPVTRVGPDHPKVRALLAQLERECDPDSPTNNYTWSSNAPPTEKHRRLILEQLHGMSDDTLAEVKSRLEDPRQDEFGEMLIVLAAAFGDESKVIPTAKLMVYSEHPAVRLSAARELQKLCDPRTIEWFDFAARNDDRRVRNDGCGRSFEIFYPVRATAQLALKDMGIEFKTTEQILREKEAQLREVMLRDFLHKGELQKRTQAKRPPPPSVPAGGIPR